MTLYDILMLFWNNRFIILSITVAFMLGYVIGNGGLNLFEE